ncbi:MAG: esterase family protein [Bacteroidales bacterium]|nr:esterase family protein [Bacteroidales bacterium]
MMASGMLAQEGKILDDLSMKSAILKMERKYAIYLPPDYETSQRSYPVLYLLHGGGGDQAEWIQRGEVNSITDKAINEGSTKPLIIVMPDASGPNRGYGNDATGKWLYEDFFFQEFITYIEKTYRIRPGKMSRSVAGLSMGGNGTFTYALHHPEMFKAACPLSAGPGPLSLETAKEFMKRNDPDLKDSMIEEWYSRQSVLELINSMPEDKKTAVRWYIDCGDDDNIANVFEGNCLIHIAMRKKEIPHEFRIRDGGHTWAYWRSALPEVLKFINFP